MIQNKILRGQGRFFTARQIWIKRLTWFIFLCLAVMTTIFLMYDEREIGDAMLRRATAKLRKTGIEHIEIRRGLWGPMIYDPRMKSQQGRCFDSVDAAVNAAIAGERPEKMGVVEKKRRHQ